MKLSLICICAVILVSSVDCQMHPRVEDMFRMFNNNPKYPNLKIMASTKNCGIFFLLALVACGSDQQLSSDWPDYFLGNNGLSRWKYDCDFRGADIGLVPSTGELCGGVCIANPNCTHFTYNTNSGFCFMKNGDKDLQRTDTNEGAICGFVPGRF